MMGGQNKQAGRDIIDSRLAFKGNEMSRFKWSSCIVLVGYLLLWGLSALPETVQVSDVQAKDKAEVVLTDAKKQPVKAAVAKEVEPVAQVIDTEAHNTEVQKVVLTDCEQLELELRKYDWDTRVMLAIAKAESSCRANAVGDKSIAYWVNGKEYGYSVGMFQIRILEGREHCDTFDIPTNVACAYKIYKDSLNNPSVADGYVPWSVYLNGMYAKYL